MKRVVFLLIFAISALQACTAPKPVSTPTIVNTPSGTQTVVPTATATSIPDVRQVVPVAPQRDLFEITQRLRLKSDAPIPRTVIMGQTDIPLGTQINIQLVDLDKNKPFTVTATLRYKTANAYFWFDQKDSTPQEDVEKAAQNFESVILPSVRKYFGDFWNPGVDGDPHLYIVHANIPQVAGYFSGLDEYPKVVNNLSNQHETIYINSGQLRVGSREYLSTLAHELQHAVEFIANPFSEVWVNEGLSELSSDLAGYPPTLVNTYFPNADVQLNAWDDEVPRTPPHYGASFLFMKYMFARYGGYEGIKEFFKIEKSGVEQVDTYLSKFNTNFEAVFADWTIANLVNSGVAGKYGYPNYLQRVRGPLVKVNVPDKKDNQQVSQYGARYFQIKPDSDFKITFDGADTVRLLPTDAHSGSNFWWGNRGDGIDSKLTREFDLTNVQKATLNYWVWYEIEKDFDFSYLEVSKDVGRTWDIVKATSTTSESALDSNYGHGYTGKSGGSDTPKWVNETANLNAYAGGKVLVRFEYISDEAVSTNGFAIDDISIPEISFVDSVESESLWAAEGFVKTSNVVKQNFIVQLIHRDKQGLPLKVEKMTLNSENGGQITANIALDGYVDSVLVVSGSTRVTTEKAEFSFSIKQ
ncbi:MAG: hypothetical protein EXR59_01830 [Dehalococcoidia bacterium]|nr:hypothetical protein [Dehalococcoidia bacterium]